ncbi:rod shape-determining protein MreC [Andreprevotia lacus DSM 23236]|jgi:rod shape-determining protein MreC|uniref:Cell shape-determining protein MreC n=1 Tax=Andreprevotia lacus DSM 23236 TaxID=1121001 RepID=A0A1W1X4U6_9NEIS|nr:rod shape-determining protein MreC [Andreprevotia lacus]SMC18481.1 rod shape-determining protein MreC [Andreprevotia lacus DSM 23236]
MQSNQPAFFKQGPKPLTRLLVFAMLSLALVIGDARYSMLGRVREQISVLLYPLQWLATAPFKAIRTGNDFLTRQADLQAENRQLHDAQLVARANEMKLKALETENTYLRGLTAAQASQPRASQLTEVLYNGRDPFSAKLIVDRGDKQGVHAGQIAIDSRGVVGQVVRVQPLTSEVRLLSDRNHMVPVEVERTQMRTVVYGMGRQQLLEIHNLAPNVDIQVGDMLHTSGIDGIYPAGLPVAKVVKVDRQATSFARILCEPLAEVDKHRFLLLLDAPGGRPAYPVEETASAPATKPKRGR